MARNRFTNTAFSESQEAKHSPLYGYQHLPILTLEEAVEKIDSLVPDVTKYVSNAKENCNRNSTKLTLNESAAIYLYSMSTAFYFCLNAALRTEDRHALKPWFAFLKLFMTALEKLPSTNATVWRGVNYDDTLTFVDNDVHVWWGVNSCSKNPRNVQPFLGDTGTLFAIDAIHGKYISEYSAFPEEQEMILMPGTRVQAKAESLSFIDRLFVVHLVEENLQSESQTEPNYLFEVIKQEYRQRSRIHRIINPSRSFPIERSYINLAIVNAEEQNEKEKHLCDAQHSNNTIMDAFEQIYGMKTAIDVKDIFRTCRNQEKQVLVFGRAGIGKSTFCRYVAYQWAMGSYWPQYELLVLIPLRCLTVNRYPLLPLGQSYSLIDLVKKEVFQYDLSEEDERLLKKQFNARKTLWILDGYDEIVQNVPSYLECLFEQLLKTENHILTSRPYMNTLSYDVQMEITGFTDENVMEYGQQFFDQIKDELYDASIKSKKLLSFLKSNPSIWCVAHIPVNLELICSLWINEDWSEIKELTITKLYSMMIEWLCRRYLTAQNVPIQKISKKELYQRCQKELIFLDSLGFNAMENNTIIIRPALLEKALDEAKVSLQEYPHILNIGVLKTFHKQGIGTQIETDKDHYFVHLSFQEYFAARYLINTLRGSSTEKAIEFIKYQKYNQRYTLVFTFASGLLSVDDTTSCINIFWDTILGEPLDLVGIRHMQLVTSCIEETINKSTNPRHTELLQWIVKCIEYSMVTQNGIISRHLSQSLQRAQSVTCDPIITGGFINLLQYEDKGIKNAMLSFISTLNILNPPSVLITSVINTLKDDREDVRQNACIVLGNMSEKAATNEVISEVISLLEDKNAFVRLRACRVLWKIGGKAITNEANSQVVSLLEDANAYVRLRACQALGNTGEKATTNKVISKLVNLLGDDNKYVRRRAYHTLGMLDEEAVTNEVISKLVIALGDENKYVRESAGKAVVMIGEKVATDEVISELVSALEDENESVRENACAALWKIGEKAATNEVISKLVSVLRDENECVRDNAYAALWKIGEKAVTSETISKLVSTFGGENEGVRRNAYVALRTIGEKAATNEVISKVVSALGDENAYVRANVCLALGQIGEKVATSEVISKLVSTLGDENEYVRENACTALKKIGELFATDEVISKLVSALEDDNVDVRAGACNALGNIGEKAATNEVIRKLVGGLADENEYVGWSACKALGKMGEKVVTNEVIRKLAVMTNSYRYYLSDLAAEAIGHLLSSSDVITQLSPKLISDLCMSKHESVCLKNVLVDHLINIFFTNENPEWLSTATLFTLLQGAAVTVTEDNVVVYDRKEPFELSVQSPQLREQLTEAFTDQAKQLHLSFEMSLEVENDS